MARIAISYRRSDSQDITGRIFDRLVMHYSKSTVFRDIDSIRPGIDFRTQIADTPKFDCASSSGEDEQTICRTGDLTVLDRGLNAAYTAVRGRLDKDKQKALSADENAWLEQRAVCKTDVACIRTAYQKRMKVLLAWP
jgi:uncharacterized protein YecT (DUF1311 family)